MNWMHHKRHADLLRLLPMGAAAGLWAAFLAEGALLLADWFGPIWLRTFFPVWMLGAAFGAFFAPTPEFLNRHFRRAGRAALAGALLSGVAGVLAFTGIVMVTGTGLENPAAAASVVAMPASLRWIWFGTSLGAMAAAAAFASSLARVHWRQGLRRAVWAAFAGGALGAGVAALGIWAKGNPWLLLPAMAAWGALLALAVFWVEERLARRWLRVLIGPGEDRFFPLDKRRITLGRMESNDIPLLEGQEVYPHHCEIKWAQDHYEIIDDEQGGVVLVNFRQVQEHPLRPGDLVKIGSVLLQYGEGSRP